MGLLYASNVIKVKLLCILTVLIIFTGIESAYAANIPEGGRVCGLGGASVSLNDFWSVNNNPAGLSEYSKISAGIAYEDKYLLKELSNKSFSLVYPVKSGVFGMSVSDYGYKNYHEDVLGICLGKKLGSKICAGIKINYFNLHLGDIYGNKGIFYFDAGFICKLTKKIEIGVLASNPNMAKLSDYNDERLPASLKLGLTYHVSPKVFIIGETSKSIYKTEIFCAGLEYRIKESACIRTGLSTCDRSFSFGFGFEIKKIIFDISFAYTQTTGYSPNSSLICNFKEVNFK
ncbi:MAG: hypothetical protein Q8880_11890 [Bacteroidota bacterium]|nr:hypothetical protein [Bacteroidota bacterium]